jgi:hypothetical protein
VVPKFVSPSDPAAQWTGAHKGPAFFAYSDNYLIDVKKTCRFLRTNQAHRSSEGATPCGSMSEV